MKFAIFRTKKLKTWSSVASSGAHTYRTIPTPNADPDLLGKNVTAIGAKGEVIEDVRRRVNEVTGGQIRKNGVLCVELLLTASPAFFDEMKPGDMKRWGQANKAWVEQTFGKKNIVHMVLHRDEKTPHLVVYAVPEVAGKMNCRALLGGADRLRALQSSYAEAMKPLGLERGLEGSKRRHVPPRDFNPERDREVGQVLDRIKSLSEPAPIPGLFALAKNGPGKALDGWKKGEKARTDQLAQEAVRVALEASEAKAEVQQLRQALQDTTQELTRTREQLGRAYETLGLSKDEIAGLRRSDVSAVAQRLGHFGEVLPGENAIDLVKRVGEFDYGQAIAWLHAEFGSRATGTMVALAAAEEAAPRPFTAAENVIAKAVARQTDGLGCDRYRITLLPAEETKKPFLPGKPKGADSEEKFFSKSSLKSMIPWLRYRNNQGDNVLITPMDEHAQYILLDDARISKAQLDAKGFKPCLIQKTSWESTQVVFKVPKELDREAVVAVFNQLNKTVGDDKITGLRHPFRLAGFRNMKPKHEREGLRPFVEIIEAVNRFCPGCTRLVEHVSTQRLELAQGEARKAQAAAPKRR